MKPLKISVSGKLYVARTISSVSALPRAIHTSEHSLSPGDLQFSLEVTLDQFCRTIKRDFGK